MDRDRPTSPGKGGGTMELILDVVDTFEIVPT
jgi:hypothetical protein